MQTIEELLSGHPFFTGLDPGAMRLISGCASNVHFGAGDFIFGEGEEANRFYVIRHGRVALEIHSPARGPLIIDSIDQGEVLGWSWLIPPYRSFCDARAVTPVSATALDGACLRGKCEAAPELGYQLLTRVAAVMYQRLQSTRIRLVDMYGKEPAGIWIRLVDMYGTEPAGIWIRLVDMYGTEPAGIWIRLVDMYGKEPAGIWLRDGRAGRCG